MKVDVKPVSVFSLLLSALMAHFVALALVTLSGPVYAAGNHYQAYLIEFDEASLLDEHRKQAGSSRGLALNSNAMKVHRSVLSNSRANHKNRIAEVIGRTPVVSHHYFVLLSGVRVKLDDDEALLLSALPEIRYVSPEPRFERLMHSSPEFVGADQIWSGEAVPGGLGVRGEGMVVAVLDSGIPLDGHPSFDNDPACGHGMDGSPDKLISAVDCTWTNVDGQCVGDTPEDVHPHGPWVASIAAGNRVIPGEATPSPSWEISGIAPCAHIRSYRVCGQQVCFGGSIISALETALVDGDVDAINYSIGNERDPWHETPGANIALTMLDLVENGILIAAGAGNASSGSTETEGLVNNIAPWAMSIASTGINRPDELSHFSLRGPTREPLGDLQKPDIAAPGSAIYGATGTGYSSGSGTSASAPHIAGAALLLAQIHPSWTPMEIASALRMTAHTDGWKDNGFVPWDWDDVGSGRLSLRHAAKAGLVMDETRDNFLAANPAIGGDLRTLNLPAARDMNCSPTCSWTRTVRNTLSGPSTWQIIVESDTPGVLLNVEPQSLSFSGGLNELADFSVSASLERDLRDHISFGTITLREQSGLSPDLHLTVAVRGVGGAQLVPQPASVSVSVLSDSQLSIPLILSNIDGSEPLEWEILDSSRSQPLEYSQEPIEPALDEPLSLSDFSLAPDQTLVQSIPAGLMSSGPVHGFTFQGTVTGVSGNFTRADDLQMMITAPDGTTFGVGGDELGWARWEFGWPESDQDGTFTSSHYGRYVFGEFGAEDEGVWMFEFRNSFLHPMHWSNVSVTLHKEQPPCQDYVTAPWLQPGALNGTVPSGGESVLPLQIDATGLPLGLHDTQLCLSSNVMFEPVSAVPVSINVVAEMAATIGFADLVQTFTGSPLVPTITTDPEGLSVTVTYDGDSSPPINVGSYEVVATIDDPNYIGSASDMLVIEPVEATISFADLVQNFTGNPLAPTITTDPKGLPISITYDGQTDQPAEIGTYLVEVLVEEENHVGSNSANFHIVSELVFRDRFEE